MSCNCKCGCDNRYSGGVQCKPLRIEVSHVWYCDYVCYGWNQNHKGSKYAPQVGGPNAENCTIIYSEEKKSGYTRTINVTVGIPVPQSDCKSTKNKISKVVFGITPPQREWNGGDPPPDQKAPYTTWDSANPDLSVKAQARFGEESDTAELYYEATSNPNPDSHSSTPDDQNYNLVVEVDSKGDVSVRFESVR